LWSRHSSSLQPSDWPPPGPARMTRLSRIQPKLRLTGWPSSALGSHRDLLASFGRVWKWPFSEVAPFAFAGRLRFQSGLVYRHIYEFTPYTAENRTGQGTRRTGREEGCEEVSRRESTHGKGSVVELGKCSFGAVSRFARHRSWPAFRSDRGRS